MSELAVVILAAGQGTRMNSKKQKILFDVGGRPMIVHVFEAAAAIADGLPVLVVGRSERGVQDLLGEQARYVEQPEQLGTGHATMMAEELLRDEAKQVLVTYGDMPLLRAETLANLAKLQSEENAAVAMLTVLGEPNSTFGRILRNESGAVQEIIEVAEARRRPDSEAILAITELNAGVYCFDSTWLWDHLPKLPLRQARRGQEYYLTDLVKLAVDEGRSVTATVVKDADECLGAGTRSELVNVEQAFRRRAIQKWLNAGVSMIDPKSVYIDQTVTIGRDTVLWPGTFLEGETVVGEDCILGPNCTIRDSHIGAGSRIEQAVVEDCILAEGYLVNPFSQLKGLR